MAEYFGGDHAVAVQKSLRSRMDEFARTPVLANGGRLLNVLDPDVYGWNNVYRDAKRDGFVALTMVDRDAALATAREIFGGDAEFPCWEAFNGSPGDVRPMCAAACSTIDLPRGWAVTAETHPSATTIEACQELNAAAGVMPAPRYYMAGYDVPGMSVCLWDRDGALAATANGTMRYHPEGPLAGWFFAGGVSVDPAHRRMGLGTYVNATLLIESQKALGWRMALEQAQADNLASVGMIARCGLRGVPGKATILINLSGMQVTR